MKTHEPEVEPKQEPLFHEKMSFKSLTSEPQPTPETEVEPKRGRPKGKRSHPLHPKVHQLRQPQLSQLAIVLKNWATAVDLPSIDKNTA